MLSGECFCTSTEQNSCCALSCVIGTGDSPCSEYFGAVAWRIRLSLGRLGPRRLLSWSAELISQRAAPSFSTSTACTASTRTNCWQGTSAHTHKHFFASAVVFTAVSAFAPACTCSNRPYCADVAASPFTGRILSNRRRSSCGISG